MSMFVRAFAFMFAKCVHSVRKALKRGELGCTIKLMVYKQPLSYYICGMDVRINQKEFSQDKMSLGAKLFSEVDSSDMYLLYIINKVERSFLFEMTKPKTVYNCLVESRGKPWCKFFTIENILLAMGYHSTQLHSAKKNFSHKFLNEPEMCFNVQKVRSLLNALLKCFDGWIDSQSIEFKLYFGLQEQQRVSFWLSAFVSNGDEETAKIYRSEIEQVNTKQFLKLFSIVNKVNCDYETT